jgi:hypothetical protein
VARLDFDRHHDGYMVAQAIAVHDGFAIQRDAFAQYGPVTPWLQSGALYLPVGPALALRLLTALLIAVSVYLMADLGRASPASWPITRSTSLWAAVTWVALADVWNGVPMLPWASVAVGAFGLGALYCGAVSLRQAELGRRARAYMAAFASGILCGILPFTRLNVGLGAIAVLALMAAFTLWRGRGVVREAALWAIGGAVLSSSGVFVTLALTGAINSYIQQCIMWPIQWGQRALQEWQTRDSLGRIVLEQSFPVALCLSALALHWGLRHRTNVSAAMRWMVHGFTVLAGVTIATILGRAAIEAAFAAVSTRSLGGLRNALAAVSVDSLNFYLCLTTAVALGALVYFAVRWIGDREFPTSVLPWLLLAGMTVAFFLQVVPTYDNRHIWWGSPFGLLLAFAVVGRLGAVNRLTGNPLFPSVVFMSIISLIAGTAYLSIDRVWGGEGTVISGMLVNRELRAAVDADTYLLLSTLPSQSPVLFLVPDGDVSVLNGHYRSIDAHFVEWGDVPPLLERLDGRPPIVISSGPDDEGLLVLAESLNYHVVARNDRLVVLVANGGLS